MPVAYSLELRQKAIAAIDRGEKKSHVSKTLKMSRNTLDLWLKRREKTGSAAPKTPVRRGPDPKNNDLVAFKQFATEHGRLTAQRMAELWPEPVSDVTLGKALKRIKFTRKSGAKSASLCGARERAPRQRLTATARETRLNAESFYSRLLTTNRLSLCSLMRQS